MFKNEYSDNVVFLRGGETTQITLWEHKVQARNKRDLVVLCFITALVAFWPI